MNANGLSTAQAQTREAFSFKWSKSDTYASPQVREEWRRWLLDKYFDGDQDAPGAFLGVGPTRILDAGCGAGMSALLLFGDNLKDHDYVGVDISDAVIEAKRNFEVEGIQGTFVQGNLQALPDELGTFDLIFSEGVLHHTDSVQDSLAYLATRLNPGGQIAFYVYAKKAPIREFTDDMVRSAIANLSDEEAWDVLMPLSALGKALGDLEVTVEVPEDIPMLGIARGSYDLQRLFFYKICKAYFRPNYSLEEMNHINFDWFRPENCWRHTTDEVEGFCAAAGLQIVRLNESESGVTVIAARPDALVGAKPDIAVGGTGG
jgi:SAM-dependent methyltransferase